MGQFMVHFEGNGDWIVRCLVRWVDDDNRVREVSHTGAVPAALDAIRDVLLLWHEEEERKEEQQETERTWEGSHTPGSRAPWLGPEERE